MNRQALNAKIRFWSPYVGIILLAGIIRLYRLPTMVLFHDDQGWDLLIIRLMEISGYRPLIGPMLTVNDVFTPPTYYYLTWLMYHASHSISGIVYGYLFMNILCLLFLMMLISDMADRKTALIAGGMFALSSVMIEHSRTYWQPYPIQLFIILGLLFLWQAFTKKNLTMLFLSVFSYILAVSTHPSPILLLPYFIFQVFRWYRTVPKLPLITTCMSTIGTFALIGLVVYIPQIIYEMQHGYPTIVALFIHPAAPMAFMEFYLKICANLVALGDTFTRFDWSFSNSFFNIRILYALFGIFMLIYVRRLATSIREFISPLALITGLSLVYFQPKELYIHYTWAYLPFIFIISSFLLGHALVGNRYQKILGIVCIVVYFFSNSSYSLRFYDEKVSQTVGLVKAIANFIRNDITTRDLNPKDITFYHTYPENDSYHTNNAYRVLYWLVDSGSIQLSLTPSGNNFVLNHSSEDSKSHVYLICFRYPSDQYSVDHCAAKIPSLAQYENSLTATIGSAYIFAYTRK